MCIAVQREMVETFGEPYEEGLSFFEKFHHKVVWKKDVNLFLDCLKRIESRERRFESELERKKKELENTQSKKAPKTIIQTRHDFIKMLNTLSKNGYSIDREKTTVEELSLMMKETQEQQNVKSS